MILRTKLQRPTVAPDIIPRDRLIKLLKERQSTPVTLISAPAGYGKSTLASLWVDDCSLPCGWISLDKQDNDLRQFISYLIAALNNIFPTTRLHTGILLEAHTLPSPGDLARNLLNDLAGIPQPFLLVLDDYHSITKVSIHDFMNILLEHPTTTMHVVLVTRKNPALPIASLRGRGMLHEIRSKDLRFTPDEVAKFMKQAFNIVMDDATVALLENRIEGWATGLRLAGLYLSGSTDVKAQVQKLSGNTSHIAEYLISEVLGRQHPETISYLLETSILDRFCAPLCSRMHQTKAGNQAASADRFVQRLSKNNLFVIALDNDGHWFRYHHLFQDFLKGVLRRQCSADRMTELHRSAGNWFAENELIEEAVGHFMAAGDTSAAVQLVIDHRYEMLNASQFVRLMRLLKQLPKKAVAECPLLATTQAFIGLDMGKDEDMYGFTQKAAQMLEELSPQSEIHAVFKGEVSVLQSLIEMILGNAENALVQAQEGLSDLPESAIMIRSLGVGVLSICHQMMGNSKRAATVIKEALSNPILPANIRARFHFYLSIVEYMDGNLAGVMNASQECLQVIMDLPFFHTRAFANYFLGIGRYLCNDRESAESVLLKVLNDRHAVNPSYVAHAGFVLVYICLSQGNEVAADRVLDRIVAHCREINSTTVLSIVQAYEAEVALRRGDFPQAQQICKYADFDVRPPLWFNYVSQLTPIKCLLAEGKVDSLEKAHTLLIEWDERMRRINRINVRIEILALLALVCHRQRDEAAALEHLQTALKLAEPGGWIRTFVDLGEQMIELLLHYTRQHAGQSFAQAVLQASQAEHAQQNVIKPDTASEKNMRGSFNNTVLTQREVEILALLAEGQSNKEIAATLNISPQTIKTHLKNIFKKLNTKNRVEALIKARKFGIFIDK